jgi:hypothetical protein
MSANLPDDPTHWPTDPFTLLGVSYGVAPRELRRAYTRLIRTYKPEQFPEHFRRIREAYEAILRQAQFYQWDGVLEKADQPVVVWPDVPAEDRPAEADHLGPVPESAPSTPVGEETSEPPPNPPEQAKDLDEFWELACSGEEVLAYRRLRELLDRQPGRVEVCLRLYWLLVLFPELEPTRAPCDWLVAGLERGDGTGPLRELYRREMADRPEEVLRAQAAKLLHLPLRPGLLADLAEWRWQAAARLGRWDVLASDLEVLRELVADAAEETWGRLLFAALDHLAWAQDEGARQLADRCRREVSQLPPLDPQWTYRLDRLDILQELSAGWRLMEQRVPESGFVKLIPLSWTRPFGEIRPMFLQMLSQIVHHPAKSLHNFDVLQRAAPAVLVQFGELLRTFQYTIPSLPEDTRSVEELRQRIHTLTLTNRTTNYPASRQRLLSFCLSESIAPEKFAELVQDRTRYWFTPKEDLAAALLGDWPLRYLCLAHRLFWA